ncbi:MAG: hypothetical protein EWV64_12680 [Microcystis flos-aquae Ma_QC_C_20070823_S18]|uniref:Uncharacterized protein n=1 Tax=Microcystis flos-aquae Mf_QC_C_20070823_S10D TaxID=2486236 RepID=A0A552L2A6_9CHRO|nr:MAG: hypothetical protein EWV64_12680 [Microcystis flos-aquae Ma_QC_C_20070823_S18]TRT98723.1 MAG: hypothetical protein EWV65_09565 [Microcystis flos-aquae Ma_QC_C_20070823_S18D]TRV14350.1 MAG: hypothetical protein EWV45_05990 [Microcystis flos-aquae Mf_QC_C_20070823_S10D]TRV28067.1 MAG: hypothetical protein EWV72_03085 [Microcystis flos-aquae Mf_QC_C_20070823_S10]TRV35270.1 MAG: hypothetical protein EWV44_14910 [Microcystis flos-aquae Mf_QC_C_20070823_S20T]TRV37119.1 MAG: hypothetical prot
MPAIKAEDRISSPPDFWLLTFLVYRHKYLSKINYTYLTTSCPLHECLSSLGNLFCTTTYIWTSPLTKGHNLCCRRD